LGNSPGQRSAIQGDGVAIGELEIFKKLSSLRLPVADYVIFGSAPILAQGLRTSVNDLDILARGAAWEKALSLGPAVAPPSGNGALVSLFGGEIEIFDRWVSDDWKPDGLIDAAELIEGFPFVPLPIVLQWKRRANRTKDQHDIAVLEKYLAQSDVKYRK
jgi:hypothetical protein